MLQLDQIGYLSILWIFMQASNWERMISGTESFEKPSGVDRERDFLVAQKQGVSVSF